MIEFALGLVVGILIGAAVVLVVSHLRAHATEARMREAFAALAGEALDANTRRLMGLLDEAGQKVTAAAGAQLDGKKALIDQSVTAVAERLERMRTLLAQMEAERKQEFGQISTSVASLSATAGELHRILASPQRRGAWGERMAEDMLRLAGLVEKINYVKQAAEYAASGRPDFTFLLPNDLKANMDVKFPLDQYKAYVDAADEEPRQTAVRELVQAVRLHCREVAGRGYIDPKIPTVPYVIVFIPSEQVLSVALSAQPDLIDEALRQKVVLCGPLTLYAMLSVIRQAAENFNVMKTADEIISHLAEFRRQWEKYVAEFEALGQRIEAAGKQFEIVRTTRTNMLQRPLDKIESLRQNQALPEAKDEEK